MFQIISCSEYAASLLSRSGTGRIHSVYSKTINLLFDGGLLALQARGAPLSPLSLETDCSEAAFSAFCPVSGTPVRRAAQCLVVGKQAFSLASVSVWHSALAALPGPLRLPDPELLAACLWDLMPTGGFSDLVLPGGSLWKSAPPALAAEGRLAACALALRAQNWAEAAGEAAGLIGLGEGLTPSGDDFLCGLLAASHGCCSPAAPVFRRALELALFPRLKETNDISAAFLRAALEGRFSQAVIALLQGAGRQEIVCRFGEIGHSSGADTLSGIYYFAKQIQKGGL